MTKSRIQTLLNILIFIGLLVAFGYFYLIDIIEKYRTKATTFTTSQKHAEDRRWPAMTICMQTPYDTDILEEYTEEHVPTVFTNKEPHKKPNITYNKLYNTVAFLVKRDFGLLVNWDQIKQPGNYEITNYGNVTVEEIYTGLFGMCYSIIPGLDFMTNKTLQVTVEPIKTTLKGMIILITSRNTYKNVIPTFWPHLSPFILNLDFEPGTLDVYLSETLWTFYNGNPDCELGCQPKHCLDFDHWIEKAKKCQNLCMPVALQNFYENDTLPICEEFKTHHCMNHGHQVGIKEKFETCQLPKSDVEYSAITKKEDTASSDAKHNYTNVKISFLSSTTTIKEEILVYDELSLVGTLGGFLGLFVGFSFFGLVSCLLEKFLSFF